ncbi:GSCOCG00011541001-RA-CDS, partial [Cotesia congregata]
KSYAIACRRFPGIHSYDRVAKMIEEIHQSFEINQDKVVATITDNGSNFVKAFKCCGINVDEFFPRDLESEEEIVSEENEWAEKQPLEKDEVDELERTLPVHIRCASHTLNLVAITDAMVSIKSSKSLEMSYNKMIERCTSLRKPLSAPKKWENVKEILGKSPKRPVPTRWNSLYDALIQLFGLKEKILSNVQTLVNKFFYQCVLLCFKRFMEEYCRCLQPIAQAIDVLQGDQTASYGHLLPTLIITRKKLLACKDLRFHYCQKLISGLVGAVEKRFKNIFDVVNEGKTAAVAAASHPMFKLRWLSHLSKEAQDNVMKAIQDAIISFPETPDNQPQQLETSSTDDFFNFEDDLSITAASTSVITNPSPAFINFVKFTAETRTDFQILNFYPTVREIFLKANTILPSSAPVEGLFSYATMFDLPKYNKLTNQNFELRVVMQYNSSIAKKK